MIYWTILDHVFKEEYVFFFDFFLDIIILSVFAEDFCFWEINILTWALLLLEGGAEVEEKELEHCSLQEKLDRELKELDKRLEQKEV